MRIGTPQQARLLLRLRQQLLYQFSAFEDSIPDLFHLCLYYFTRSSSIIFDNHFMSWQSAARGGLLRTLQCSALPRRTGVIGLQNQLSRVCLAAKSGLARPQIQPISSIQSLSQSNSFATASTPPKASKTPKAKSPKKADSETKKKRPLTEKQQEAQRLKKLSNRIKELKATALIRPPKRLPSAAYTLAICEKMREIKGEYNHPELFLIAAERAKSISGDELQVCPLGHLRIR
jgi:hypothetical protein